MNLKAPPVDACTAAQEAVDSIMMDLASLEQAVAVHAAAVLELGEFCRQSGLRRENFDLKVAAGTAAGVL